ncbi:Bulb-type lectin domain [Dillenia turbinata]|uniref:Bulb-type lectin domain n=1 Tax=Dillenia turbinata TaxID=194707 RepID=A0AAN8V069_9MAGN
MWSYSSIVVWVANRDHPLRPDIPGFFGIGHDGNLKVVDGSGKVYWHAKDVPSSQVCDWTGNVTVN